MIPLTLALSLQGRGDYSWFLPLEGGGLERG